MIRLTVCFTITTCFTVLFHIQKVHGVSESSSESLERYEFEERILKNYSNHFQAKIRPHGTTHVNVSIYIHDARMKAGSKISYDLYNPWDVTLTIREAWHDPRLAYNIGEGRISDNYSYFPMNFPKNIWKPDTFFPDAEKAEFAFVTTPNTLFWHYPNGDILYTLRLYLTLSCRQTSMPRRFGHGIGVPVACPLSLSSFGYTSDQLVLHWDEKDPLEINENLYTQNNANYCLLDKATTNATSEVHRREGNFSIISAEFQFLC